MSSTLARCLVLSAMALPFAGSQQKSKPAIVAIVVHPKNPVSDLKLSWLRSYFELRKEFWRSRRRVRVYVRPGRSVVTRVLLAVVYRKSQRELARYWKTQQQRGRSSRPRLLKTAKAVGAKILANRWALSAVLLENVPKGAKVMKINGKKPGEPGYPLVDVPKGAPASPGG